MLLAARHVHQQTGMRHLCLAGRRRLELRRQRADPARGAVRQHLDSARGGRCRRRFGRGAVHLAPVAGQPATVRANRRPAGFVAGPELLHANTSGNRSMHWGPCTSRLPTKPSCAIAWRRCWPSRKSWAGCRGGWNSDPAPWVRAASWATRAARDAIGDEFEDQVSRIVPALCSRRCCANAPRTISRCGPRTRAPTCCWWPTSNLRSVWARIRPTPHKGWTS
jgi:hypothetical protein